MRARAPPTPTRPITRALVVHGIFSSNLVPVCEKIGVAPPLDEDLGKRTISQPDIRMMRNVVRALTALSVVVWVMSVLVELLSGETGQGGWGWGEQHEVREGASDV